MAEVLGFKWYDEFNENLGPRWVYYLFRLLNREDRNVAINGVWVIAQLSSDGLWKHASWVSRQVELGASPDLSELFALKPWLEDYSLN